MLDNTWFHQSVQTNRLTVVQKGPWPCPDNNDEADGDESSERHANELQKKANELQKKAYQAQKKADKAKKVRKAEADDE